MSNPNFAEWVEKLREKYGEFASISIDYNAYRTKFRKEPYPIEVDYFLYVGDNHVSESYDTLESLEKAVMRHLND
jgi:hypothetical protein